MEKILSTCGFCSCGCALYVEPRNGQIGSLCPSVSHPVSTGRLCFKGWHGTPAMLGSDRLRTPLIRKEGKLQSASWDEALDLTASTLKRVSSGTSPSSIGIIGSSKTTNEECYSLVKLARSVIGTPNIDGPCRFYEASLIHSLLGTIGVPASQIDIPSIPMAGSMLVVGANVMDQLPHIGSRVQDAYENGCKVIAADPRISRIKPQATLYFQPMPGTDLFWLRSLIKAIIAKKLYVDDVPQLLGFEELSASLSDIPVSLPGNIYGITADEIREAAKILAENRPAIIMFGLGVLQQHNSTQIVKALADIAILLGGKVLPLRGQNNAQGATDMGLTYDLMPGYEAIMVPEVKHRWESTWNCSLPSAPGKSAVEMIRACASGDLKALLIFGENVALSAPNTEESKSALDKVDFLAVSDVYLNETAQLADVVFPACSFLEKDGTFTNIERRVQRVRKVFEPIGDSRSDLDIIAALSLALGNEVSADPEQVAKEIAQYVPMYAGLSYEMLEKTWGKPWSIEAQVPKFAPIPAAEPEQNDEYPFHLIAARINYHQQTGSMSRQFGILKREYPESYAELSKSDADRLGVRPGKFVKITSKTGSLVRSVLLNDLIPVGSIHVPHYFGGDSPNALASWDSDLISGTPAYKACKVKVEAIR